MACGKDVETLKMLEYGEVTGEVIDVGRGEVSVKFLINNRFRLVTVKPCTIEKVVKKSWIKRLFGLFTI
jgi:hypothetical protein